MQTGLEYSHSKHDILGMRLSGMYWNMWVESQFVGCWVKPIETFFPIEQKLPMVEFLSAIKIGKPQ